MATDNQFKSTFFGGFKKDEVIGYIDETAENARKTEAALQGKLKELEICRAGLEREAAAFSEKIKELEEKLVHQKEEQKKVEFDFSALVFEKQEKIDAQAQQLKQREAEIEACRNEIKAYIEEQKRLRGQVDEYQAKSEKYDKIKESLTQVRVEAELEAEKVVEEAREQAMDTIAVTDEIAADVQKLKEQTGQLAGNEIPDDRLEAFYQALDQVLETVQQRKEKFYARHHLPDVPEKENRTPQDTIAFDHAMFHRYHNSEQEENSLIERLRRAEQALSEEDFSENIPNGGAADAGK